jgi:8-oxo-dGTP diphosphatase
LFYRRKTYRVTPEQVAPFTAFFEEYLLPNQLKHGARLVGRWVTEARDEIVALWEYASREAYERIEAAVRADELHVRAQARRRELGDLFLESRQEFLTATGHYHAPRHIVSASACITNLQGEVLLVRTYERGDTWELPGGQVEVGEAPPAAAAREVWEESGLEVAIGDMVGVYFNEVRGIVNLVFRGEVTGGEARPSPETQEVAFLPPEEALNRITRPHYRIRLEDALAGRTAVYRNFRPGR